MAQQTQASRAAEAWGRFMGRFPTAAALADAAPAEVLRAWQGLGYNRRAVHLQQAARRIVDVHGGRLPADVVALEGLPGVGPYTARAVAALAFGQPVGAVDTNVRRVITRLVGRAPGSLPAPVVQRLADAAVDPARPGDWTHGLMDVGARLCRPRRTDCPACPLAAWCRSADRPRPGAARRRAGATASPPFRSTRRWLRGRIVERLRHVDDGGWVRFDEPIGEHDRDAVASALGSLAREGLVELEATDPVLARLPRRPAGATLAGR